MRICSSVMRAPRPPKTPAAREHLRELVRLALFDERTYTNDGPFDESERPWSDRHADSVRGHFAWAGCEEEEAKWIVVQVRGPHVDSRRAAVLLSECSAVLRSHNEHWDREMRALAEDPDPRLRQLMLRALPDAYGSARNEEAPDAAQSPRGPRKR